VRGEKEKGSHRKERRVREQEARKESVPRWKKRGKQVYTYILSTQFQSDRDSRGYSNTINEEGVRNCT
jgi:hypothetical protein